MSKRRYLGVSGWRKRRWGFCEGRELLEWWEMWKPW